MGKIVKKERNQMLRIDKAILDTNGVICDKIGRASCRERVSA